MRKREMRHLLEKYPEAKIVQIELRHEEAVRTYEMKIEEAHKRAAKSKLRFDYEI